MNDRKAKKFMPFDALEGFKESLNNIHRKYNYLEKPVLSEDQLEELDSLLLECYAKMNLINFDYYNDGVITNYTGFIDEIDVLKKCIILQDKKRFLISNIIKMNIK